MNKWMTVEDLGRTRCRLRENMRRTSLLALGTTLFAATLCVPNLALAKSVETTFRTECRKMNDRGCSANSEGVYQAPSGYFLEPDSMSAGQVENYWNKQPRCGAPELSGRVGIPFPGTTVVATFYTSFKAPLHVESGSGFGNIGKVAFVNCRYSFNISPLPK